MPVEKNETLNIVCDNPACPGNDLDPADRMGWFIVTSEFYGEPTQQHVFCSAECAGVAVTDPDVSFGEKTKDKEPKT